MNAAATDARARTDMENMSAVYAAAGAAVGYIVTVQTVRIVVCYKIHKVFVTDFSHGYAVDADFAGYFGGDKLDFFHGRNIYDRKTDRAVVCSVGKPDIEKPRSSVARPLP